MRNRKRRRLWPVIQAAVGLGACAAIWWVEHRRELRHARVEPKERRVARNIAIAGATALVTQFAEAPVVRPLSARVENRRRGLLQTVRLPRWLELPLAVILMDYTLYIWHILLHRVPLLWRMHAVHHIDLELDASTAVRFHFSEFLASVPYRAAQVILIGVRPDALKLWQILTGISVVFHHSNLRLPFALEKTLSRLVVTPRVHGIHHSVVPEEVNSNFSSGLMLWDYIHRTVRLNVRQDDITIGVPTVRDPHRATFPRMMVYPFEEQSEAIELDANLLRRTSPEDSSPSQLLP